MTDFTPNLLRAHDLILSLLSHIHSVPVDRLLYHAPVLDRIYLPSSDVADTKPKGKERCWRQDEVMGLRKYVEQVEQHEQLIKSIIDSGIPPQEDPLPSVQGMETFWKIIISCEPPLVGVRMPMGGEAEIFVPSRGSNLKGRKKDAKGGKSAKKEKEVWVDVIARGGREWVRIYSKKISHLLAEFREADSYVNSDFESDSEVNGGGNGTEPEMVNSLLRTARDLVAASKAAPKIPGAPDPQLTIWLTRIPPSPNQLPADHYSPDDNEWPDARIPKTLALLQEMGINICYLSPPPTSSLSGHPVPKPLPPSMRINFDITALLGLCSDVLHHPLPRSKEEAAARSLRPKEHLIGKGSAERGRDGTGKGRGKVKKGLEEECEEDSILRGQSQNSRELYRCILEEMERPWVEEFDQVIRQAWIDHKVRHGLSASEDGEPRVEFWCTKEAAQYTFEALTSGPAHGHGQEQKRMKRMLGKEEGDFFQGSRYEGEEGVMKDFRIKIFDDGAACSEKDGTERTGFHESLEAITKTFLDEYYLSQAPASTSHLPKHAPVLLANFLQSKKISTPPVAKITLPFPVVSLHSLHRGAKEGMTTVMMGTATFKEVWGQSRWKVRGWERAAYNLAPGGTAEERQERGNAAVLIFPYRVFGEGKRVKFESGDYTYPNKETGDAGDRKEVEEEE